jgi:hypothetical protein
MNAHEPARWKVVYTSVRRVLERLHLLEWIAHWLGLPMAAIAGLLVTGWSWFQALPAWKAALLGIAVFVVVEAAVVIVFKVFLSRTSDPGSSVTGSPYRIERHADGSATVKGDVQFDMADNHVAVVELPTFERAPRSVDFVRATGVADRPKVTEITQSTFTAEISSTRAVGRWTWIVTGKLK